MTIRRNKRKYEGRVIVVTGAGSGIGQATAIELANLGARIHAADLNLPSVEGTVQQIKDAGNYAVAHEMDVADLAAVEKVRDAILADEDHVDILINNAGIGANGLVENIDISQWRRVIDVNVMGVIHGVHAFGPQMLERGSGHIINTASAAGLTPVPGLVPYATSKHAVIGLTESLNAEWSPRGVNVSAVCPGIINTAIANTLAAEARPGAKEGVLKMYEKYGADPVDVAKAFVHVIDRKVLIRPVPRRQVNLEWWLRRLHPPLAQPTARLKQKMWGG